MSQDFDPPRLCELAANLLHSDEVHAGHVDPIVGVDDFYLQQQQLEKKEGFRVLGQRARQLILADLAGWFDEGQEQQRQQQLDALAAAVSWRQLGSNSRKRVRAGLGGAAAGVDLAEECSVGSLEVLCEADDLPEQQQLSVHVQGDCDQRAYSADVAAAELVPK